MKDIIINVDSTSHKVNFPDEFLGIGYENLQGNLIFQFDNNFIGGEARLEVSIDEESGIIPSLTHYENGYILPIKSSLLTGTNVLMQLVIDETSLTKYTLTTDTQVNQNKTYYEKVGNDYLPVENPNAHDLPTYYEANTPVFKTDIFSLKVKDSINAQETIPEQYPTWINTFNILVATLNQKLLLVDQALTEMDNLNISVSNKVNGEVTIIFTDKEGNVKVVKINDGRGIVSITKTGTIGNVDTYTIKYTDNTTSTFQVTNGIDGTDGVGIESIYFKGTSGLTDTYTILYTDGTTTEFQVKNGRGITKIEKISTNLLVDTYKITFNDGTTQNYEITNGKGIVSIEKTSTDGLTDIYTITYNDNTTTTFNVVNGKGIVSIEKTSTSGYVDTYTITYNDGTTTTYEVTNGEVSQAQLDALQDELNYYKTIVNALPKITGTGTYITLNNTANSILSNLLNPNIYQETTTGINLLNNNVATTTRNSVVFTNLGNNEFNLNGTLTSGTDGYLGTGLNMPLEEGQTYTLYFECFGGTMTNPASAVNIALNGTRNGASVFNMHYTSIRNVNSPLILKSTFTATGTEVITACFLYSGAGTTFNNYKVRVMLYKGTADLSWEKYTGGIPAPNPNFPMPIHTISGNNTICVVGKNWLNNEMESGTLNATGQPDTTSTGVIRTKNYSIVKPSTQYRLSNDKNYACYIYEYDKDYNFIKSYTGGAYQSSPVVITTDSNTKFIKVRGISNQSDLSVKYMLSEGSTAVDYEPYQGQSVLIPLGNIEYCKIGNYADRFFKNVIDDIDYSDTLILGAWYIKKNIGKVVLDENTIGINFVSSRTNTILVAKSISDLLNVGNVNALDLYINRFVNTAVYGNDIDGVQHSQNTLYISIDKSNLSTYDVEGFKIWLGSNNVIVYYPLATPTYTQITGTLANELEYIYNQMLAYKGQTNISQINNDLPFIIDSTALKDLTNL